ncbi:MAG TPA: acylphosphatase [Phycisphaerales bacterium]|nr:acylphosphatase [Phycisphaerales bacterium]
MRKRVRYVGRVQGVGFRATAHAVAARFRVTGWVRNEADGSVLMEVQGDEEIVAGVLHELGRVMERNIRGAHETAIPVVDREDGFHIQR